MHTAFASSKSRRCPAAPAIIGAVLFACLTATGLAHPVPDVPIWAFFEPGGSARIKIEIDVRCFAKDPENEPYLQHWVLNEMTGEEKSALLKQAAEFVRKAVVFRFEPAGAMEPDFTFEFERLGQGKLEKTVDPVVIAGEWIVSLPEDATGYGIEALPEGGFSLLFLNHINDVAVPRFQVLFPREKSYLLDLTEVRHGPAKE